MRSLGIRANCFAESVDVLLYFCFGHADVLDALRPPVQPPTETTLSEVVREDRFQRAGQLKDSCPGPAVSLRARS